MSVNLIPIHVQMAMTVKIHQVGKVTFLMRFTGLTLPGGFNFMNLFLLLIEI